MNLRFEYTNGSSENFIALCHSLDDFLNEIAGGEENRAAYISHNKFDDIHNVIIVYDNDLPIGCVSYQKYDDNCAEVKRAFIKPEYRGKGISHHMMELLENLVQEKGYRYLILESGGPLKAAIALYQARGYEVIPNYGPYENMPDSVCMRKEL